MHKSLQEFDFWHIQTADIVELIGPEKTIALLLANYSKYFNEFTWWLSGERSLPFGLLVLFGSAVDNMTKTDTADHIKYASKTYFWNMACAIHVMFTSIGFYQKCPNWGNLSYDVKIF